MINALKYGDANTPVSVKIRASGEEVILSVHNQGNPIPPDSQKEIFKQHRRLRAAKHGEQKGWGLGLTLVRGIVEAHGGTVSVESNPDHGTTFFVRVPKGSVTRGKASA